jgi:hypothetical protein
MSSVNVLVGTPAHPNTLNTLARPNRTRTHTTRAVFYSTYGHIYKLAQAVAEGASSVEGVTVRLARFPETLSDEILTKMHALEAKVPEPCPCVWCVRGVAHVWCVRPVVCGARAGVNDHRSRRVAISFPENRSSGKTCRR